jgi:hypothetical protein
MSKDFAVSILSDATSDPVEAFEVMLSPMAGSASLAQPATATAVIDYQSRGQLQFSAANYTVSETTSTFSVPVIRSGGSYGRVGVLYSTAPGTAIYGADLVGTGGLLTFESGQTSNAINIFIVNNAAFEPEEYFSVALGGPEGGAILGTNINTVVHIVDDDPPPLITQIQPESERSYRLSWNSNSGEFYRVQYKDRIEDASWIDLAGNIPGDSPTTSTLVIAPVGVHQRFYRIARVGGP